MKTLIKLALVALVLNGLYQTGSVYWEHYELEDAIEKAIQFSRQATPEEIRETVLSLADERRIPLDARNLAVEHSGRYVTVDASYVRDIPVLPRYPRPFDFTLHVSVLRLN
jgi:hypothetical protein